ncbi:nucleotide-diphospho-sugar transferase [Aspergillus floccosus]
MSAADGSAVYCTLLLSDNYLPGAVVLAHSLRDNGTKAKLVVLYTPDTLQPATINELQTVYDELVPVHPTINNTPANLWLMDRPDLIATFTKIELWRQTQYRRIVYIDCDVVAVRAPDELLSLEVDFAAAPDVGWPDCFNSGVMVLRPNMQDYFALKALAERGVSFDGADQGLLNMHFRNWHRLSFTYNCTPSASYQYIPAYKHFQSTISMVHFIGAQKPWNMPRQVSPTEAPYNQLLGRWWAIYDRHYRPVISTPDSGAVTPTTQHQVYEEDSLEPRPQQFPKPVTPQVHFPEPLQEPSSEIQPSIPPTPQVLPPYVPSEGGGHYVGYIPPKPPVPTQDVLPGSSEWPVTAPPPGAEIHMPEPQAPVLSVVPQYVRGEEHVATYVTQHPGTTTAAIPVQQHLESEIPHASSHPSEPQAYQAPAEPAPPCEPPRQPPPTQPEPPIFEAPKSEWDASREPPPRNTKPEGIALEKKTYQMSDDRQLFQPPPFYPEAPKNMYYDVPKTKPEPTKLAQIFPWESHAPKPTRVFLEDEQSSVSAPSTKPSIESTMNVAESAQSARSSTSWSSEEAPPPSFVSWDTYSRSNAWDEVPEIQKYIQSIQQPRKAKVQVLSGAAGPSASASAGPTGTLLTDFPSKEERPSLPVTPAPIRRPPPSPSRRDEDMATEQFPAAPGVPNQEDWVGLTVDVFLQLLRATYLYWEFTESIDAPRGPSSAAI